MAERTCSSWPSSTTYERSKRTLARAPIPAATQPPIQAGLDRPQKTKFVSYRSIRTHKLLIDCLHWMPSHRSALVYIGQA
jgi:hypothetical protein